MDFKYFGKTENAKLLLIPGLGVSYEIFSPLISRLEKDFCIIVVQVDGVKCHSYVPARCRNQIKSLII